MGEGWPCNTGPPGLFPKVIAAVCADFSIHYASAYQPPLLHFLSYHLHYTTSSTLHLPNVQSTLPSIVHPQQPDFPPYRTTSSHFTTLRFDRFASHYIITPLPSFLLFTVLLPLYHHFYKNRPTLSPISVTTVHFNHSDPTPILLDLINQSNRSNSL
ncbi:hypothetical protein CROQUDRAFT_109810 [Cronartium quercuum f. sp. fusiforme G11]|uniref:Uncharacterized protein n=1 Tax=Cronartium quercuum f. sp. fusiforme G11 TaxID=708437 RepID=A0A9P6NE51_9BASI|nr:hypothetical protein CROQUDRAFT_109810 [Cronartium quercuum f. sp. fusiforme G11]